MEERLSRSEQAYQKLLEGIREGTLKPGCRIKESEIAEWMSFSRTPVREALKRLEASGLLIIEPYSGMQIAKLDYQEVMELYFMRTVLESSAAGLAARHASEAEVFSLDEILKKHEKSNNPVDQARHNRMFHNAIFHAAHNRYLLKSLKSLRDSMALLGKTTFELAGRFDSVMAEHRDIFNAIAARDVEQAKQAASRHIQEAQKARIKILDLDDYDQ